MENNTEVQSTVLNEEQIEQVINPETQTEEEVVLPSDEGEAELIGGKFKSQDDLLEAYKNLEAKLGKPKEEEPAKEEPKVDEEYEAYKKEKATKELLDPIGGVDKYKEALAWARENMSEAEVNEFNEALGEAKDNPNTVKLLAKSLIDKYEGSVDKPATRIHSGETTKMESVKGYATKSEMLKDINNTRYHKDPSYRQKVEAKLALTDTSSWYSGLPNY